MQEYLITLILGIVQGITEFLPISSDGHLELAKFLTGDQSGAADSLQLTVILHMATALSIMVVFRKDIVQILGNLITKRDQPTLIFSRNVILSMIPAGIVGLFFEEQVSRLFEGRIMLVSILLFLNGLILLSSRIRPPGQGDITGTKAFIMGLSQALAILPGISRSGSTISTAMLLNIDRNQAATFSFLMVVPLILGKIAKDLLDGGLMVSNYSLGAVSLGFIAAFFTGIFACRLMILVVQRIKLHYFAWYCMAAGALMILYLQFVA
jgi:undecaprenyl-diphosphatase